MFYAKKYEEYLPENDKDEEYYSNTATLIADKNVKAGSPVVMKDNFTVTAVTDYSEVFGVCLEKKDNYAVVQISGYVELPIRGEIPLGITGLMVHKDGKHIFKNANGNKHKVLYADDSVVGFIL